MLARETPISSAILRTRPPVTTEVYVALADLLRLADVSRAEAAAAIGKMKLTGYRTVVLTATEGKSLTPPRASLAWMRFGPNCLRIRSSPVCASFGTEAILLRLWQTLQIDEPSVG